MLNFVQAATPAQIEEARKLFREYQAWLGLDLEFQDFETELAELPGKYALPSGCLLLATESEKVFGCAALRRIDDEVCEMKRLFVRPSAQGRGVGKILVNEVFKKARNIGYRKMRLDTLAPQMQNAVALYRAVGFQEIPAYYHNPIPGTLFMELILPSD